MARKRMIDPAFWDSLCMGRCCRESRLLFLGLVSLADDEGRLLADPMWLKSRLFPFDQDINAGDLADMLDELVRADEDDPCIWRYEMDGKPYIQLPKWSDYQKPSHPQPSKLPICPPDQVPKGHRLPEDFHEAVSDTKKSKKKGSS